MHFVLSTYRGKYNFILLFIIGANLASSALSQEFCFPFCKNKKNKQTIKQTDKMIDE